MLLVLTTETDSLKLEWPAEIEASIIAWNGTQGNYEEGVFVPVFAGPAATVAGVVQDFVKKIVALYPPGSVKAVLDQIDAKKAELQVAQDAVIVPQPGK